MGTRDSLPYVGKFDDDNDWAGPYAGQTMHSNNTHSFLKKKDPK